MSNKDLLKQAIAEAKTIREAAIANAKEALEETLTPHLKEMLAQKLQEMEDADDMDESTVNQAGSEDYSQDPAKHGNIGDLNEEEEEEAPEEEAEEGEEEEEELEIEDMSVEDLKNLIRDIVAQEVGHDEEAEVETGEESKDDMTSIDDSEEIDINELLAELEGMDESSYNKNPKDSDKSGPNDGFTNPSKRTPANSKHGNKYEPGKGSKPGRETFTNESEELNEMDGGPARDRGTSHKDTGNELDTQLINAIKSAFGKAGKAIPQWFIDNVKGTKGQNSAPAEFGSFEESVELNEMDGGPARDRGTSHKDTGNELDIRLKNAIISAAKKAGMPVADFFKTHILGTPGEPMLQRESEELEEALSTVSQLRTQLQEVNLLNAKLLYVNKVFKSTNLSEGQKVNVIAAFDKAETVKEVKLVFETVSKNVVAKPAALKEHRSFASKATGNAQTTAPKEILSEVSEQVQRWQKLAGIIKS